jgi:isoleucyl-tRNA synthetase
LIGNLYDFDPEKDFVPVEEMLEIDRYILKKLKGIVDRVKKSYDEYLFHEVYHTVYSFCVVDLSAFYLDILKDRVYTFRWDSKERRSAQSAFYILLTTLTCLIAPVLSFTAEEVWQYMPFRDKAESVFLAGFPSLQENIMDEETEKKWATLEMVRKEVLKALEIKRKEKFIGSSLEASVVIHAPPELKGLLLEYRDFLPTLFIVSSVELTDKPLDNSYTSQEGGLKINIQRAPGKKCERCWNYSTTVGENHQHPSLCHRCINAIS